MSMPLSLIIHECSEPLRWRPSPTVNTTDDLFERAAAKPGHVVFLRKTGGVLQPVTARQFADQVVALARGLIAVGVQPGDRIVLWSASRFEWVLCDYAIWAAGAVTVPVRETAPIEQVARIVDDCAPVAVFTEDGGHRPQFDLPVWEMTGDGLDALVRTGAAVPADEVGRRRRAVVAHSPATICYTAGTTGDPRGCVISHGNLVAMVRNAARADGVQESVLNEHSRLLLFLPLAHIFARVVQLIAVHNGAVTVHTRDGQNPAAELHAVRPTSLVAAPHVFEELYDTLRQAALAPGRRRLFRAAERTAVDYSRALDRGRPTLITRVRHWVFDRLVYGRIRQAAGGRIECAVSGGAPLDTRLAHFFRGAGISVLEGYGLTESSFAVALNLPGAHRIGTVGPPIPGVAVRIADDGEVLVRGPGVFEGYLHDERATREAFLDGWLRTGDVGVLDGRYLVITGRKKDTIEMSDSTSASQK